MGHKFATEEPDYSHPLSRFNAHYWAMMHGVAAALSPGEWAVLCAIFCHLPNPELGKALLAAESGTSKSTVKRARNRLRRAGLIDFKDDLDGGENHDEPTKYRVADIRRPNIADAITARLGASEATTPADDSAAKRGAAQRIAARSATMGVHHDPTPEVAMTPPGVQDGPTPGVTVDPKVLKGSSQGRAQAKSDTGLPAGAAALPPDAKGVVAVFKAAGENVHKPLPSGIANGGFVDSPVFAIPMVIGRPFPVATGAGAPAASISAATDKRSKRH